MYRKENLKNINYEKDATDINSDIDFSIIPVKSQPLGLINRPNENVCFFNSVIQVFYSIPECHQYIYQLEPTDDAVSEIKKLFTQIESSTDPISTSVCVQNLGLTDYRFGYQYDAQECMMHLIGKIFPRPLNAPVPDNCIFKVSLLSTTTCERCYKFTSEKSETNGI